MKKLIGVIVSTKMQKTVVVRIERQTIHPKYMKIMKSARRYKAHSEDSSLKEGDRVELVSVRPLSKDKHYKVAAKIK